MEYEKGIGQGSVIGGSMRYERRCSSIVVRKISDYVGKPLNRIKDTQYEHYTNFIREIGIHPLAKVTNDLMGD